MLTVLRTQTRTLKKWFPSLKIKTINQKEIEKIWNLNTNFGSVDTFVNIGATSTSITLSITGIGLKILPKLARKGCTLSSGNKALHKLIINKDNKYKKHYQKEQQLKKSFDKLEKKSLQDNLIDKNEYDSPCIFFTTYLDETRNESFP